ncbi:MAG: hypothetical protein ACPGVC_11205 [Salibacteraceae bacterium]
MKKCLNCDELVIGRNDKKFCSSYCKSSYHYQQAKKKENSLFLKIEKQLKLNRRLLKAYNKAGKATVRKEVLLKDGFNPNYFTNYWKNKRGEVYLFCFEFGFLQKEEHGRSKFVLIKWQNYM